MPKKKVAPFGTTSIIQRMLKLLYKVEGIHFSNSDDEVKPQTFLRLSDCDERSIDLFYFTILNQTETYIIKQFFFDIHKNMDIFLN